jgi:hypothetical protein
MLKGERDKNSMLDKLSRVGYSPVNYLIRQLTAVKNNIERNKQCLLFVFISLAFTLWFCRFIFSSSSEVLGIDFTTLRADSYAAFAAMTKEVGIIHSGHVPMGVFWLPDFYGGSIATYFHISSIPDIGYTPFLILTYISGDVVLSLKIIAVIALIIAQICSYKLAKHYFHNTSIAWILSVAYSFSAFFASKINAGHLQFVFAAALLPGVFLLFEKMLVSPSRKNMAFASIALILLFLSDLQITIFSILYIILRIAYHLVTQPNRNEKLTIIKRLSELTSIFALSVAPFLISFSWLQNVGGLTVGFNSTYYTSAFSSFVLRGEGSDISPLSGTVNFSNYLGITLLGLSLIPIVLSKIQLKFNRQNYVFHWLTFLFFSLIAMGPLSVLVTSLFVRAPNRGQIIMIFSICICAGYGLLCLNNFLKPKLQRNHWSIKKSKIFQTLLIVSLATIIFADLSSEVYPLTAPAPKLTGGHLFIENQKGDFRILQYPVVWCVSDYESTLINHQIIGETVIAIRASPPNSELFDKLSTDFAKIASSSNVDAENLTLLATLCAAKYALIETNSSLGVKSSNYINFFNNASEYFRVVYSDQDSVVYENLYFKGFAFAVKDDGQIPVLENINISEFSKIEVPDAQINVTNSFNRIDISANISTPSYLVISQSYYPYWVFNNEENSSGFTKFLNLTALQVDKGTYKVTAVFSVRDQTWNLYIACFVPLALIGLVLYADSKAKTRLFKVGLSSLFLCGILLMSLTLLEGNKAPSLSNWTIFGPFNKIVLLLGGLVNLIAIFGFTKDRVFNLIGLSWVKTRKLLSQISKPKIVEQTKLKSASALTKKMNVSYSSLHNLTKLLTVWLLLRIFIEYLPFPSQSNNKSLLDAIFLVSFSVIVLLYIVSNLLFSDKRPEIVSSSAPTGTSSNAGLSKQTGSIRHLHLGILGGLVGVCVAGLLMRLLTSYTQDYVSLGLVFCGALGGVGFEALTSGNNRLRGLIGCVFGLIGIIVGLMMTYTTPIIAGYMQILTSNTMVPLYRWHEYSFVRFLVMQLLTSDGVFYSLSGLVVAYLGASHLSLKLKFKKRDMKTVSN